MKEYNTYTDGRRTLRDVLFLLGIAIALGLGLALTSPALGAALHQSADGDIAGTITVAGGNASGITVELRQRANNGADTLLATTTTDASGAYHFTKESSAPNDAYYLIKVTGGKGMLAVWYSFPIIYLSGQNFTVPSIEMSDVALLSPKQGDKLALPGKLTWQARRSGETFRIYVYDSANLGKALLDSGSLGMNSEYALPENALAPANYEAVVQVRDAVVGFGVSQAHFKFSIVAGAGGGVASEPTMEVNPGSATPETAPPTAAPPAPTPDAEGQPNLQLHLTADKTEVDQGGTIIYKIEVTNDGSVPAPSVIVTDKLPASVAADGSMVKSSTGLVSVDGNNVTAEIGDLAPNATASIEIPVTVGADGTSNVSNQVSALYLGAANPVMSNAYVAQIAIAEAPAAPTEQPVATEQPEAEPTTAPAEQPTAAPAPPSSPAAPTAVTSAPTVAAAPTAKPKPTQATKVAGGGAGSDPKAPIPQTGGSFPLTFALLLLVATLAARYLRGQLRGRNGRRT